MILSDLHVHSRFCDGKDLPEDLVLSAIEKGVKRLGIVAHSFVPFDDNAILLPKNREKFIQTVNALKEEYKGEIEILCGLEKDVYSSDDGNGFDYVIGSAHYFLIDNRYFPVDYSAEAFQQIVEELLGGDYYLAAELYFRSLEGLVVGRKPDVIGHFDLVTKFNKNGAFFDVNNERYRKAWQRAADFLLPYGIPFEVNTGAIARGYRKEPYPALEIVEYVKSKGGKLILSSDAHKKENVAFQFEKWQKYVSV
jgi:histidinol-phosphatase (PHP family)